MTRRYVTDCIYRPPVTVIFVAIFWISATVWRQQICIRQAKISTSGTIVHTDNSSPGHTLQSFDIVDPDPHWQTKTRRLQNVYITNIIINVKIKWLPLICICRWLQFKKIRIRQINLYQDKTAVTVTFLNEEKK
jgi:hypothetical protein